MDIASLLSNSDVTITSASGTPLPSPRAQVKSFHKKTADPRRSPSPPPATVTSIPQHLLSPQASSPTGASGTHSTTPPVTTQSSRQSLTPSMDTLADLASMQNHQPAKTAAPVLRAKDSYESTQLSPSTIFPIINAVSVTSNPRSSFDIAMADASKQSKRTDFSDTSLGDEARDQATTVTAKLAESPYSYENHHQLITILHQGFVDHVYPADSPGSNGDPQTYDLLPDLRQARETMDKLFAIGEDLWADWLQDESMLAHTTEEKMAVMENCIRAVEEEYGSTKLWVTHGDWLVHCYSACQDTTAGGMSTDDQLVGREVFTWDLVLETWRTGAEQTMWRVNDSHLVWDRYIELKLKNLHGSRDPGMVAEIRRLFNERLTTPHANWENTAQMFSAFLTDHFSSMYENIMMDTTRFAKQARAQWDAREAKENALQQAQETGDTVAEYNAFVEYVDWERTPGKGRKTDHALINGLYQRAELRFPSDAALWEDHALYLIESQSDRSASLQLLNRATRHCPWSGSLWQQYILSSERASQTYSQTEEIKHKATQTGLLDVGGMDEVVKVHTAWCSYLRRRAFKRNSNDEDLDVAEMGIRSSIETMKDLATQRNGVDAVPDVNYRLERIYIKYLTESGSWDSARETFRTMTSKFGHQWQFWIRYYIWEMVAWSNFTAVESQEAGVRKITSPHYATAVLREAVKRSDIDWPEVVYQAYMTHCEDHEDIDELQAAIIEVRQAERALAKKRQLQAVRDAEVEAQAEQAAEHNQERTDEVAANLHLGKRKRADGEGDDFLAKKVKADDQHSVGTELQPKRDRENASILIQSLPKEVTELKIRQFFRDCGTINSLKVIKGKETSAVVEFEDAETAQFALSRDGRQIEGQTVHIQLGSGSTLFVANFPPAADEAFIRQNFEPFGEIIDVRFPSLKFNTHRRFCYVQYNLNQSARKASDELDGKELVPGLKLTAKLSDPTAKQDRSGAMEEGREIYVRNIAWSASENDLEDLFSKHVDGTIESVRIPRAPTGKSKGFAFLVFASAEEARAALAMDKHTWQSRELHVEISGKKEAKRHATTIVSRIDDSKSPSASANGAASPSAMSVTSASQETYHTIGDRQSRTIALMNVPDTVNNARVQVLVEKYGQLVKVSLRPDHQGAIVEYLDAADAGKASLGLEGHEIVPGRKLRVGTVPEMLKEKGEKKIDKLQIGKQKTGTTMQPAPVRRPTQQSGRRGGLGQQRGLGFASGATKPHQDVKGDQKGGKSQDDFRALLNARKEDQNKSENNMEE